MNATIEAQPVAGELRRDEAMSKHTSWRVGGPADYFFKPASVDGLVAFLVRLGAEVTVTYALLDPGAGGEQDNQSH